MPAVKAAIYLLCLLASAGCAGLLIRSYAQGRGRLQLWSALCFGFLALDNLLVVLDLVILPSVDLLLLRQLTTLAAVAVLLFGFVLEAG
jgi:hypothetical protein